MTMSHMCHVIVSYRVDMSW